MAQIQAEDVHVANLLHVGDVTGYYTRQYDYGEASEYQKGEYALISGQEDPRTPHLGHTIFLNLKSPIHDDQTYFLYAFSGETMTGPVPMALVEEARVR